MKWIKKGWIDGSNADVSPGEVGVAGQEGGAQLIQDGSRNAGRVDAGSVGELDSGQR